MWDFIKTIVPQFNYMIPLHSAEPPTAVRNLRVNSKTNTSITIQWDPPSITGRSDYYYNVEYSNMSK